MAVSFFMPFKSTDGRAVVQNRYSRAGRGSFVEKLLLGAVGADTDLRFLLRPFRCSPTSFAAAGVSFFYDSFCSSELHLRLHFSFWPAKTEKRSKEKSAAHLPLKNRTGHYPPRNSRAEQKSSFRMIYGYPTMHDARSDKRCG